MLQPDSLLSCTISAFDKVPQEHVMIPRIILLVQNANIYKSTKNIFSKNLKNLSKLCGALLLNNIFVLQGKTMLCLPQAFEMFLKHLVGGLHTVYTKLKRLEIMPLVCNVEQVRILR